MVTATKKEVGDEGEAMALSHLQRHGLRLVQRHYRVAGGRHARAAEVDLIVTDRDGTLVFVEVRRRDGSGHGGAAASVGATKQARLLLAARCYLQRYASPPPCRFDVVAIDGDRIEWLQAAFDASP